MKCRAPALHRLCARKTSTAALTDNQVLRIRDGSTAVVVPCDVAQAMEEQQGYVDIDATDPWQSGLQLRDAQA
jgi:aminopeptidase C